MSECSLHAAIICDSSEAVGVHMRRWKAKLWLLQTKPLPAPSSPVHLLLQIPVPWKALRYPGNSDCVLQAFPGTAEFSTAAVWVWAELWALQCLVRAAQLHPSAASAESCKPGSLAEQAAGETHTIKNPNKLLLIWKAAKNPFQNILGLSQFTRAHIAFPAHTLALLWFPLLAIYSEQS